MRQVLLRPGEDGWGSAEVPSLPGAISQGKTREEVLRNSGEAIELSEDGMRESGQAMGRPGIMVKGVRPKVEGVAINVYGNWTQG